MQTNIIEKNLIMSLLIIGGTGSLGRQIVRKALEQGFQVRCLVRNKRTANFLREWGAELVYGDLTLPETLPLSFQGITALIDASTSRSEDDDKMIEVDWYGKLMLIELAKRVHLKRFIFFSIFNAEKYPFISIMFMKTNLEKVLKKSGVPYTIFKCAGFFQALINQYAIPILEGKAVWATSESTPISYIDTQDAARFCLKSLFLRKTINKTFFLGSPKTWLSDEIIRLCETFSGQKAKIQYIPIPVLKFFRQVTGFFEYSLKISDRLAFSEVLMDSPDFTNLVGELYQVFNINPNELLAVDSYLREYFEMMLITLENLNVDKEIEKKNLIL